VRRGGNLRKGFCREIVYGDRDFSGHQCARRAVKEGYCKQHHPDAKKARQEASEKKWRDECAATKKRHADEEAAAEAVIQARINTALVDFREEAAKIVDEIGITIDAERAAAMIRALAIGPTK